MSSICFWGIVLNILIDTEVDNFAFFSPQFVRAPLRLRVGEHLFFYVGPDKARAINEACTLTLAVLNKRKEFRSLVSMDGKYAIFKELSKAAHFFFCNARNWRMNRDAQGCT